VTGERERAGLAGVSRGVTLLVPIVICSSKTPGSFRGCGCAAAARTL